MRLEINNIKMNEINSEREWRRYLIEEVRTLRQDIKSELKEVHKENKVIIETLTTLKVKIGVASGVIGGVSGLIVTYLKAKLGQ